MSSRQTSFQAIGTNWEIDVQDGISNHAWTRLIGRLHERIETFDTSYSRFRSDALVTAISKKSGTYAAPPDCYTMLNFYRQLYDATSGKVTPLIGQTLVEAGYDASYSFQKKTLHKPPAWDDVLSYDKNSITTNQPILLDFGAAGKGYLVDIVSELLEDAKIKTYLVNAGGDIRYRSELADPLEIGLENPMDTSEAIGIATLTNGSLCASAGCKRKWSGINHIIDPGTLVSPEEIIATWAQADDTMTADGLATALFFSKPDVLLKRFTFSYAILRKDMSLEYAKGFPVKIFEAS